MVSLVKVSSICPYPSLLLSSGKSSPSINVPSRSNVTSNGIHRQKLQASPSNGDPVAYVGDDELEELPLDKIIRVVGSMGVFALAFRLAYWMMVSALYIL